MEISRAADRKAGSPPAEWFTGEVRMEPLVNPPDPARAVAVNVTFAPGARTAWHTHPLGQTIIITDGVGRVQRDGGPVEEVRAGDVVHFPPGERHWHGAAPTTGMTHIAVHERQDGKTADWQEPVSEADYAG